MARREKTFLEERVNARVSEKREERANDPEKYVKGILSTSKAMSPAPPSALAELQESKRAKRLEGIAAMGNTQSAANAAKDSIRDRDSLGRFTSTIKVSRKTNQSLKSLEGVFKEHSSKLLNVLQKNHKEQLKALAARPGGAGSSSPFGMLGDLFDLGGDGKGKKGQGGGRRRGGRGGARGAAVRNASGMMGRAWDATKGFGSRAVNATKGFGSRSVSALENSGGRFSSAPGLARNALGSIKNGATSVIEVGSRVLKPAAQLGGRAISSLGNVGSNALGKGGTALSNIGSKMVGTLGNVGGSIKGAMGASGGAGGIGIMGKVAGVLAPAAGAYEAYNVLNDDTKTAGEKGQGVANAAGGVAGSLAGATAGAMMGTAILPGWGTALGGAAGGMAGYFGGEALVNSIGTSITDSLVDSKVGEVLGKSVAVVMSPFSEDARHALKTDWKENMTAMDKTLEPMTAMSTSLITKLGDYTDALGKASGEVWNGIKAAASTVVSGVKEATGQVAAGYEKGGVKGALSAAGAAATTVGRSASTAGGQIKEGVANAGSTISYAKEKGSASAVELAMGFSAKKGITGLSDSQTKAYAGNVMKTESGGKLGITNQYGFAGQYQFGADALSDNGLIDTGKLAAAKKASGKDWYKGGGHKAFLEDNSNWKNEGGRDAFLKDKQLQDDTFSAYTNKNIAGGYRKDKSGKSALNANSTPGEIAAYAKAAHLKGVGGANSLIKDGVDSQDANGTKTSKYAKDGADAMLTLASQVDAKKAGGVVTAKATPTPTPTTAVATSTEVKYDTDKAKRNGKGVPPPITVAQAVPTEAAAQAAKTSAEIKYDKMKVQYDAAKERRDGPTTTVAMGTVASATAEPKVTAQPTVSQTTIESPVVSRSPTSMARNVEPTASAAPMPSALVAKSTPVEIQPVAVTNAPKVAQQSVAAQGQGSSGGPSSQPTLDEVPLQITDLGLVLLNIGHI